MREEFKNKFDSLLQDFDNSMLQTKLKKLIEKLKKGEHSDIIKKLKKTDTQELIEKLQNLENLTSSEVEEFKKSFANNITKEDIESIQEKLDPEKQQIIEKIISTLDIT